MAIPFSLLEIDHVVLRVANLQRSVDFYLDVIGCSIERHQEAIGLMQLRAGRSLIDLVPVDGKLGRMGGAPPGLEARNMDHVCLRVDPWDAEAITEHLRTMGASPGNVAARFGAEGEGPSIYVSDPDGNVVELKGPPE